MSTPHDLNRERQWVCARRINARRHTLGLTQWDVVERMAALGVTGTNRTLSAMEHGQGIDVGRLPELAVALDCTVTYLLGLTKDPQSWVPDDRSVDVTASLNRSGAHSSWILGPDVPDLHNPEPPGLASPERGPAGPERPTSEPQLPAAQVPAAQVPAPPAARVAERENA
jgi:transcriptional regulator with XRE-family HTH domain